MLRSLKPHPDHEDFFIQRYDWLMGWALKLTNHNQEQAEDLVHDAFIQFTLRRPDLATIENADAYLNRMLRNMYLSKVRRANLIKDLSLSIAAYDSAEIGLRTIDPRDQIKVQDDLRQICQYACARKESSKAGSTLILRFFHSYYPSEIARILHSSQRPVYDWLKIARREARLYLENPLALKSITGTQTPKLPSFGRTETTAELLNELRAAIFKSRSGDCLSRKELRALYADQAGEAIDSSTAAHLVSCPNCLDEVNRTLGLPPLSERFLTERLGKDTRPPDDEDKGPTGGAPEAGRKIAPKKKQQSRLKEVIEHRPQELRILVNGFLVGSQLVSSEFNKQTLSVNIDEPVGFVEVFSEQWIRLLFFEVEQPINGSVEQQAQAEFNDGRSLELNLSFRGTWPVLDVAYHDPGFEADLVQSLADVQSPTSNVQSRTSGESERITQPVRQADVGPRTFDLGRFRLWMWDLGRWFRPGTVTAVLALILIAVLLFLKLNQPQAPITATELLHRASAAEETANARPDTVLHRTLTLEVRSVQPGGVSGQGDLIARNRVEIWQDTAKGLKASRLFDEKNNLIAGDWRRADGSRIFFNHGSKLQSAAAAEPNASVTFENAWQIIPTAKDFSALIGNLAAARVEETPETYLIKYDSQAADNGVLVSATLVLSKADLHPIEQRLVLADNRQSTIPTSRDRQSIEYRLIETSLERRATNSVAPAIFEPDTALLSSLPRETRNSELETPNSKPETAPAVATAELEVEVLNLLSQAGADLDEQTSVTRTSDGRLRVSGLVESEKQKQEILRALRSVANNPAIDIQVDTVAEAAKRQAQSRASTGATTVERIEVEKSTIPTYSEIRRHVGSDEEVGRFASRMVNRSSDAMSHAAVLRRLLKQFSADDLRALSPEARAKWLGMIRAHARAFQRDVAALTQDLQLIFPGQTRGSAETSAIDNDKDLANAVERLYAVGITNDQVIRSAFTTSATGAAVSAIRTAQFWNSLKLAEALAARIQNVR